MQRQWWTNCPTWFLLPASGRGEGALLTAGDDQRSGSLRSLATVDGGGRQRARNHRPYLSAGAKGRRLFGSVGCRNGYGSRRRLQDILSSPGSHAGKRAGNQKRHGRGRSYAPQREVGGPGSLGVLRGAVKSFSAPRTAAPRSNIPAADTAGPVNGPTITLLLTPGSYVAHQPSARKRSQSDQPEHPGQRSAFTGYEQGGNSQDQDWCDDQQSQQQGPGTAPGPKTAKPVKPPSMSKASGWPSSCCHNGAASKVSGNPGSASNERGLSKTDIAYGRNKARVGRSDHHSVLPRCPRTTAASITATAIGPPNNDGAEAVTTAMARPAAAAAVHDGVPLMPGLPTIRAGRRLSWVPPAEAAPPWATADPEARNSARRSSGIMTCATKRRDDPR